MENEVIPEVRKRRGG